ncbi:hypothetical protein MBLNU457_g0099t1 [Dothideomycetes sp. NU457]
MKPNTRLFTNALILLAATSTAALSIPRHSTPQTPLHSSPSTMSTSITLSDVLPQARQINIFAGLTRDIDTISSRLDSQSANSTLLAPSNGVLQSLPRKPWEDPEMSADAFVGDQGQERAKRNLERFVAAHVVPAAPWGEGEKVRTLDGGRVWWEGRQGKRWIMPGDVEVDEVLKTVGNGEIWVLKGLLNYAS